MTVLQNFKQFFTPSQYSQIVIESLNIKSPTKIIDLAIGEGSLLLQAMRRWPSAQYFGNDIDPKCCEKICLNYSNIISHNYNIFSNTTIDFLLDAIGTVDLCLGNPPFDLIEQNDDIRFILKLFNLDQIYKSKYIPCEIVFILQCLQILEKEGHLAIILPDGFFVNSMLAPFRYFLIHSYQIEKIIELPNNIFKNTEAKTHILILKNSKPTKNTIILSSVEADTRAIEINQTNAIQRMDYSYHAFSTKKCDLRLSDMDIHFIRGIPKYKLQDIDHRLILHTTNFSKGNIFKNNYSSTKKLSKYERIIAIPGDIIISRVGSYSVGKVGIVEKGYFIITDCVFIIRTPNKKMQKTVYAALSSSEGQKWIKAHSKGVAARHLTLSDIRNFPISFENPHVI